MKKADVMDDILDIFIRKAMEELESSTTKKGTLSGLKLDSKPNIHRAKNSKQNNRRGDSNEVYATASSR